MRVYCADVRPLTRSETLFNEKLKEVSPLRAARALRPRAPEERSLCLGAGLLLGIAARENGIDAAKEEPATEKNGKPTFARFPSFHFSLSHAGKYAVCVTAATGVGCDVEMIAPPREAVCRRLFTPEERGYVYSFASPEERAKAFTRVWTLRESFGKCAGGGLSAFARSGGMSDPGGVPRVAGKEEYVFFTPGLFEDACLSICLFSPGNDEKIEIERVEFS